MEETQRRILEAARAVITGENALAGFSIDAVARGAGVTRMTVYQRFGSKRGLLESLFDEVGRRGQLGEKLPRVFARPDAVEATRAYVELFCEFWAGERALNRRLRAFAALDEEFASAIAARYERRRHAWETLLNRLSEGGHELAFAPREELVQTLLGLTSFEFYDVLAGEREASAVAETVFGLVMGELGLKL